MLKSRTKAIWLIGFIVLVLIMISIGGVTRLTRSGLSIVEWKPVVGMIPPLSETDWIAQFELYKQSPEFQKINSHFTLNDYKKIFFWEYIHRLFGRIIFLYILLPGLYLWRKNIVEGRIVCLFSAMVAFQGLIGWLMVKSGLNTRPHVSPYMLTLHYFLALGVLSTAYYYLSQMRKALPVKMDRRKSLLFKVMGVLIGLQVFYGCLTSGFRAGLYYNTYPLMGGQFLPPAGLGLSPSWINIFENPVTIQWIHRWVGALTLIVIFMTAKAFWKTAGKGPMIHLVGISFCQIILGISTLLLAVPISLATIHQLVAALIVLGYLNIQFRLQPL